MYGSIYNSTPCKAGGKVVLHLHVALAWKVCRKGTVGQLQQQDPALFTGCLLGWHVMS